MSGILRGTTPDFIIKVKKEDFNVDEVLQLEITVWNGSHQRIYGLDDVTINTTDNSYGIHFTEQDTLNMDSSKTFKWQMRAELFDNNIVGTQQSTPISIEPLKSREVMSG